MKSPRIFFPSARARRHRVSWWAPLLVSCSVCLIEGCQLELPTPSSESPPEQPLVLTASTNVQSAIDQLEFSVRNQSKARCEVAATSVGTLSVERAERNNEPLVPTLALVALDESVGSVIERSYVELDPSSASKAIVIPIVSRGPVPERRALQLLHQLSSGKSVAQEIEISEAGSYKVQLMYWPLGRHTSSKTTAACSLQPQPVQLNFDIE